MISYVYTGAGIADDLQSPPLACSEVYVIEFLTKDRTGEQR